MQTALQETARLLALGQTEQALEILKKQSDDPACQIRLREYYMGEQQYEAAAALIAQMTGTDDTEQWVNQSITAFFNQDWTGAIGLAEAALNITPDAATAQNHLGRALQNAGQSGRAIKAFKSAVRYQPDYAEAWHNLAHTRRALGLLHEAEEYYLEALKFHAGYQSALFNLAVTQSVLEDYSQAMGHFRQLLKVNPQHVLGWVNTGLTHHVLGEVDESMKCYDQAMELDPGCAIAYSYKGVVLNELQQTEVAIKCLQHAISLDPQEVDAWCELTNIHEKLNDLENAQMANDKALAIDPHHPTALIDRARILSRNKQHQDALNALRQVPVKQLPVRKQIEYFFESGTVLDRLKQYDEAFKAYQQGNQLATTSPRFQQVDAGAFARRLKDLNQAAEQIEKPHGWLKSLLQKKPRADRLLGSQLCFLMGFPRSGTTLMDTILNVHQQLLTVEEKPTLERVIEDMDSAPWSQQAPSADQLAQWRQHYWHSLSEYMSGDAQLVVDKLPLRFIQAQLIHAMLPQAKILFMLRHPCDVVLSNFMQNYMPNQAFVHFNELAESVQMYQQTMDLWLKLRDVFGQQLLEVRYEDLVNQPQQTVPAVCDFLGVPFSQEMLDTDQRLKAKNRISTNSYAQVAQNIHQQSVMRWENYREYFAPHLSQLKPFIKLFGYPDPG
ncbi:tetratricopeptide repeat-containing sulfotransferase family protein [Marinicella sediminis]|uniref:Tetratricopeptide repeat-containing sulfotransferase family protein n=1 Tax=Marinicella sediminis TaxID=1792834 RepID=A0ABV7J7Y7_9GAMM|nr:tetratricopeptide repeat-containing sulfotransferase family protein [Marinicella sediminis]